VDFVIGEPFHHPVAEVAAGDAGAVAQPHAMLVDALEGRGLDQLAMVNGLQVIDVHAVRGERAPRQRERVRAEGARGDRAERADFGGRQIECRLRAGEHEDAAEALDHRQAKLRRAGKRSAVLADELSVGRDDAVMERAAQIVAHDGAVSKVTSGMGAMRRERDRASVVAPAVEHDLAASERTREDRARAQF
jgi:hypothetical protein